MIINDFYVEDISVFPFKADAPLGINPDTVLTLPVVGIRGNNWV